MDSSTWFLMIKVSSKEGPTTLSKIIHILYVKLVNQVPILRKTKIWRYWLILESMIAVKHLRKLRAH